MSQKIVFAFASLLVAFVAFSCNNLNDEEMIGLSGSPFHRPTEPPPVPSLSASHTIDNVVYTFSIPKATYGINVTLSATLTIYNQSMSVKTIGVQCSPAYMVNWSL